MLAILKHVVMMVEIVFKNVILVFVIIHHLVMVFVIQNVEIKIAHMIIVIVLVPIITLMI